VTMSKGFPIESGSAMDLLYKAVLWAGTYQDREIVTCSDCGQRVSYDYIGHHYIEPVHPGAGLAPDWCARLVCRDCAPGHNADAGGDHAQ
jgi:hypothetical protein